MGGQKTAIDLKWELRTKGCLQIPARLGKPGAVAVGPLLHLEA